MKAHIIVSPRMCPGPCEHRSQQSVKEVSHEESTSDLRLCSSWAAHGRRSSGGKPSPRPWSARLPTPPARSSSTPRLSITETNTGVSRTANTNESGNYSFPNLPPGTYSVTAEMTGFKKVTRGGVDVLVDTTTRVDLSLQPGQITETIEVTAEAASAPDGSRRYRTQDRNGAARQPADRLQPQLPVAAQSGARHHPRVPAALRVLQLPGLADHPGKRRQPHRQQRPVRRRRQQPPHRSADRCSSRPSKRCRTSTSAPATTKRSSDAPAAP